MLVTIRRLSNTNRIILQNNCFFSSKPLPCWKTSWQFPAPVHGLPCVFMCLLLTIHLVFVLTMWAKLTSALHRGLHRVGSAQFDTKLDLLKGYWQVPLPPHASEISTFVMPDSFLQYTVMLFGLKNAPVTSQHLMHKGLPGVRKCEVYLYDIVAYFDTWTEHIKTLAAVFSRLRKASLTLNLS